MTTDATPRHVSDEDLYRMACNELPAAEVVRVRDHLEECAECAEVWSAVEAVRSAALEFDPGALAPPELMPRTPILFSRALRLVAAAVVALLGLGIWSVIASRDVPPPDAGDPVVRSLGTSVPVPASPAEGSRVERPRFAWSDVEEAVAYRVEVLDGEGEVLWVSPGIEETSVDWPDDLQARPGLHYWRVSAHFEDGEDAVASDLVSFTIGGGDRGSSSDD